MTSEIPSGWYALASVIESKTFQAELAPEAQVNDFGDLQNLGVANFDSAVMRVSLDGRMLEVREPRVARTDASATGATIGDDFYYPHRCEGEAIGFMLDADGVAGAGDCMN